MLFLLILTLCYSVSSFDLEKTINNLKDGNLVNGLLDGIMKNKENREEIVENLEKFEKNTKLFNVLRVKNPEEEADSGFGRNTDVKSGPRPVPIHPQPRFCQRVDLECCCDHCGASDCDSDLPDSLDWSQHLAMPARMRNSSNDPVADLIAEYVELRYFYRYREEVPPLAAEQLTDCKESWEDDVSWVGPVSRLMIQGGFELKSVYEDDKTDANCRFQDEKVAVYVTPCYQLNIEKENCLKGIVTTFGPVLVGLRKSNWINDVRLNCDPVLDTYTPFILMGYGKVSVLDVWWVMSPEGTVLSIPRGVACLDIGMYTLAFDIW